MPAVPHVRVGISVLLGPALLLSVHLAATASGHRQFAVLLVQDITFLQLGAVNN